MEGYGSPLVKNPLTTESRMTPLSTQFLKNHQNAQQCLCRAAPVWASQCLACPERCLDLACPSWEHQGWSGQTRPLSTELCAQWGSHPRGLKKTVLFSLSVSRSSCHRSPAAIHCCCVPATAGCFCLLLDASWHCEEDRWGREQLQGPS